MELPTSTPEAREPLSDLVAYPCPSFVDQMNDRTRQGLIQSALGMEHGLGSDTSISGNVQRVGIYAEQEVLSRTALLLEEAMTHSKISEDIARRAEDVYETSLSLAKKN